MNKEHKKNSFSKLFYTFVGLFLLLVHQTAFAIVIGPDTIINTPTTYSNTTLDLNNGNFIVRNGASLTINNCTIIGSISPIIANLISVEWGSLNLTNNKVSISAVLIHPTPRREASFYAIKLGRTLSANISGNSFTIDKQFSVGFLTSTLILPALNVVISNNTFQNFHGVIYLLNSHNSIINHNLLKFNSSGNIVLVGDDSRITNNSIYFSGLNQFGDAITIVDSEGVTVAKNTIFTPTSESISIVLSHNIVVDSNTITGGITYAMHLFSHSDPNSIDSIGNRMLAKMNRKTVRHLETSDITISNNFMSQNRYGIAAVDVNNLNVFGNYFSQRFATPALRKFWTDNSVLLKNVSNVNWTNNFYKEAFTQVNKGDNSMTQFVIFPATGGVVL